MVHYFCSLNAQNKYFWSVAQCVSPIETAEKGGYGLIDFKLNKLPLVTDVYLKSFKALRKGEGDFFLCKYSVVLYDDRITFPFLRWSDYFKFPLRIRTILT